MSETITINGFPVEKLGAARATLADLHSKLAKAAAKAGATPPTAPTFETVPPTKNGEPMTPPFDAKCTACLKRYAGFLVKDGPADCPSDGCGGVLLKYELVDLVVTADKPALAGWEFLAVIEPMEGGNLVKRVPGSDESFDLTGYRTGNALSCDHCNTVRARSETFVVKADGTDPAVAAGTVKKVGRNCLANFLGGKSAAMVLMRMTWEKVLKDLSEGEGGGGGGWKSPTWSFETFLSWTCSVVRLDGWVSRGAASAYNEAGGSKTATVDRVFYLLAPPFAREALAKWREDVKTYTPVDADKEKAVKVLEWAKALEGKSDYEYNLKLVANQSAFDSKNAGLLASAVGSYDRAVLGALAKAKMEAEVKATAPLGKGVEFEGEIIKTSVTESEWGTQERMTVKVTNPDGSVWFAWGSIPSSLGNLVSWAADGTPTVKGYLVRDDMVGRKVAVKASLEAGKDPHFVFMKRPSVEFIDEFCYPRPQAPKKPRAKKAPKVEETV